MIDVLLPEWRKSDNVILFSKLMENMAELKCLGMRLSKTKQKKKSTSSYALIYLFIYLFI
jgi:hypothetical protein